MEVPANQTLYVVCGGDNVVAVNMSSGDIVSSISGVDGSIGFDPAIQLLYATQDEPGQNYLVLIRPFPLLQVAEVQVDQGPVAAALDPATGEIYVADRGSANVSVVNASTRVLVTNVAVGKEPDGVAYDAASGDIYVTEFGSEAADVIDPGNHQVLTSIPLINSAGSLPTAVCYDAWNRDVYALDSESYDMWEINGTTNVLIADLTDTTDGAGDLVCDAANGNVYVTNGPGGLDSVSVLSGSTNTVVGQVYGQLPANLSWDPANGDLYVSSIGNLSIISTANLQVLGSISLGPEGAESMGYDSGLGVVVDPGTPANDISVISADQESIVKVINGSVGINGHSYTSVATLPEEAVYDPTLSTVYVENKNGNNVTLYSDPNLDPIGTYTAPSPYNLVTPAMVFDPDADAMLIGVTDFPSYYAIEEVSGTSSSYFLESPDLEGYNGDGPTAMCWGSELMVLTDDSIVAVSESTHTVVKVFSDTYGTADIACDLTDQLAYVTNSASNNATVINMTTNQIVGNPGVGTSPYGVAWDGTTDTVYVANFVTDNLTVLSGTGVIGSISVGTNPYSVVWDSLNNSLYVSDVGTSGITVISGSGMGPGLANVSIQPSTLTVLQGQNASLSASISCTGGPCPTGGIGFSWSTTSVLGNFTSPFGSPVNLEAGKAPGAFAIFVNATVFGVTRQSLPTLVQIPPIQLVSVSVSPASTTLRMGTSSDFNATTSCSGGPCPSNTSFQWNLSSPLGTLNSSTGDAVEFLAGSQPGTCTLSVNATLGKVTAQSNTVQVIVLPRLARASISPGNASLPTGASITLVAEAIGTTGSSIGAAQIRWSVSPADLGSFNTTNGSQAEFTAGSLAGTAHLSVNVSYEGVSVSASAVLAIVPGLDSVTISPDLVEVLTLGNVTLEASPACAGGPCPSGTVYSWTLTNSLGDLNRTSGRLVGLEAGASNGNVSIFVNATLEGITVQSSVASVSILSPREMLTGVGISPGSATLLRSESGTFNASAVCVTSECPAGISYSWSLSKPSLATLSSDSGSSVSVTAGGTLGDTLLFVNASLWGWTVESAGTSITISPGTGPSLLAVAIDPVGASVGTGGSQTFRAILTCSPSGCPASGVTYAWNLSNGLGTLSSTALNQTTFTAGSQNGTDVLHLNLTWDGLAFATFVTVTITPAPPSSGGGPLASLSGLWEYLLVGLLFVIGALLWVFNRRRSRARQSDRVEATRDRGEWPPPRGESAEPSGSSSMPLASPSTTEMSGGTSEPAGASPEDASSSPVPPPRDTLPSPSPRPRFCTECGIQLENEGRFCMECGAAAE